MSDSCMLSWFQFHLLSTKFVIMVFNFVVRIFYWCEEINSKETCFVKPLISVPRQPRVDSKLQHISANLCMTNMAERRRYKRITDEDRGRLIDAFNGDGIYIIWIRYIQLYDIYELDFSRHFCKRCNYILQKMIKVCIIYKLSIGSFLNDISFSGTPCISYNSALIVNLYELTVDICIKWTWTIYKWEELWQWNKVKTSTQSSLSIIWNNIHETINFPSEQELTFIWIP